jgi:Flp pilus assembly protein TadD
MSDIRLACCWHVNMTTLSRLHSCGRPHELAPENARYAYVYAIAMNSTGEMDQAVTMLEETDHRHPTDRDVLIALVTISCDTGNLSAALRHARELELLDPSNAALHALVTQMEKQLAR